MQWRSGHGVGAVHTVRPVAVADHHLDGVVRDVEANGPPTLPPPHPEEEGHTCEAKESDAHCDPVTGGRLPTSDQQPDRRGQRWGATRSASPIDTHRCSRRDAVG